MFIIVSEGVSNIEIEKLIEKSDNDLKKNFFEVVFSNNISHFIRFCNLIKKICKIFFFDYEYCQTR